MKNKNGEITSIDNYNNINRKIEWINSSNDEYIFSSINNGINPIINLLIDSIDRFSFGELLDDDIINEKIKVNIAPNNYLSVNYKSKKETDLINEKLIISNIEEIIDYNNIDKTNLEKDEEKKKDEDEDKNKNKICGVFTKEDFDIKIKLNHRLNDSFEKKYYNPLENEKDNENKNKFEVNIKGDNNNKIVNNDDSNIGKNNKEKNIEIKKDIINGNNNNNEDDYLIIVDDDNNIKEVKFNNSNEYNYDLIPTNNSQQIDSVINTKITNSNENLNYNILNEENPKIKKENIYCKDNIINIHIPKEKNINLPLSLSSNKENKENKKDENNTFTSNKITDIDVKEKILELSEKLEKSEKNIKMIKSTNDKLLEIINNFTNFKISDEDKYINMKKNDIKNSFKDMPEKKRYFSPFSNNEKINLKIIDKNDKKKYLNKEKDNGNHKKSKSFNKLKVNVDGNYSGKQNNKINYYKINGYDLSRGNKYSLIYKKEKNKKVIKSKLYKREKQKDKNKLIRNTIFLTGANNYSKKIKNYDNYPLDSYEAINGNYLYNHSFPSSRSNHNKSEILMTNGIGNIYQREVMKLPPEQQPLFYESNTKFFINNYLYTNNINTTCNDTISFNEQKLNFDEKYNYIKPKNGNNYLNIETNGNKRHKNKLLDFKDFQVIFEEKDDKLVKPDENIISINQAYIMNNSNSNTNSDSNLEKNKKVNNKISIPSLKSKINFLKNNKNLNINFNNLKENGKITKKESGIKENGIKKYNINKYSDFINQKYNHLFRNQKNDINNNINDNNIKIVSEPRINKNKNQYMIPFYLINIKDLCNNIINSSNTKKK